jgi:hypothetical protein
VGAEIEHRALEALVLDAGHRHQEPPGQEFMLGVFDHAGHERSIGSEGDGFKS